MIKLSLTLIITSILISGCATPLQVISSPTDKTPLALSTPAPLRLTGPLWTTITPKNADTVWEEHLKNGIDPALFCLTDEGYKQLAIDFAQIRNLIDEQRQIIIKYKEYYESPKEKEKSLMERYYGDKKEPATK